MDELLGRKVPYDRKAEQSLLGAILIDPSIISEVVVHVKAEEFYIDVNQQIFETISSMFVMGKTVDPVTVQDEMRARGYWKENSEQYLKELMYATPTVVNAVDYSKIVRERALLRALGTTATEIAEQVYQDAGRAHELLELAERKIYALRKESTTGGLEKLALVLRDVMSQISQAYAGGGKMPGISTGLTDIDECLQGLGEGDFIVIASRPGMGKTSIALNMAVNVAKTTGKTVAIFSLEMSRTQMAQRIIASESHIDLYDLNQGRLNTEEWKRLGEAVGVLSTVDILIDDNPSMTVADMAAQCRRLNNLGLVVVDYLQLMQSAGNNNGRSLANENRQQVVSDISRMMKVTAKELRVPLICMSQLRRPSETRADKRPTLSELRESGSIEQDADAVIGLYREGYYDRECEDPNSAEAIVMKNRRGKTDTIYLRWLPEYTTYVNDSRHHGDEH